MERQEKISFSPNAKFLFNGEFSIIFNRLNRKWIKVPRVCQETLEECNQHKYSFGTLMDAMADDEDRSYMSEVVQSLVDMEVLGFQMPRQRLHDVSFAISNRCNLHCKHCMVNVDTCSSKENFTTEEIISALDKIIAANPEGITITGGEALVRTDFKEIITYLRGNYAGHVSLMTNGTLINEKNIKYILPSVNSIDISLDGVNEETCSIVRGKGVFKKVVSAINLLKENKFDQITTSMIVSANNQNYVDDFFELNERLGCKGILRALSFVGQAEKNKRLLTTSFSEQQEEVVPLAYKNEKGNRNFYTCSCAAGCKTLTIESDGSIFPCNLFIEPEHRLGNIMGIESLEECLVLDNKDFLSKSLLKYEPDNMEKCKTCNVNYFCWSCIHQMVDFESQEDFDQRCAGMKRYLQSVWA
ncbi:radical SAM/SPASM domain-containing protein [Paenibacillus graminis]|uniref:Radical SAM protein n=1 Tax=Paenibacillus graminis TaxID=189425 RepID=A0A089MAZ8_9BACL|nr:radical SAM protein [Paenibacillus graminis]AIQ70986.1 radical SAM protein [Paenibacillus graminis]